MYPRDGTRDAHFQGRCKVRLFADDGKTPLDASIRTRSIILSID